MRKLLLAIVVVLCFWTVAAAQYVKVLGVAGKSGSATTSGISSTNKPFITYPLSTITIYAAGTTTPLSIFSASTGTVKVNPFTATAEAYYDFFVAPGAAFDVRVSGVSNGVTIIPFTRAGYVAPGTSGISLALCGGTADTALLAALDTIGGTIEIPKSITCASNTQTISAALQIDNGGLLKSITGQTVTLTGPQLGPVADRFTNATSGLGSISFTGNTSLNTVYPQWWVGASLGVQVAAANVALPSTGGTVDMQSTSGTIGVNTFSGVTKPITMLLGVGTYIVTVQQTYATSANTAGLQLIGAGEYATIIENRVASGYAFYLDGSNGGAASSVFQRGAVLRDFSIVPPASSPPASSQGIGLRANHAPMITRVRVNGLSSHGMQIVNENGDADAVAYLTMTNCRLLSNTGWGFYMADDPAGLNASGSFLFFNNEIVGNGSGGMRAVGLNWSILGGSITQNVGYGIYVPRLVQTFNTLHVSDVEMDANTLAHVNLEAGAGLSFDRLKVLTTGSVPAVAFKIGKTGGGSVVSGAEFNSTVLRRDAAITVFQIADNAVNTFIRELTETGSGTVTQYTDAGTGSTIILNNQSIGAASSTTNQTGLSGTYTPNGKIVLHRITISAATLTIANPTGAEDGREIRLDITNVSGGATVVTFGAAFIKAGYVNPTDGQRTCAIFQYHAASTTWRQIGAWSTPA